MAIPSALPFFRESGCGPIVLCVHCNASSSSQWRPLMERLASQRHVIAPDTHGAGRGPAWPSGRRLVLADEVELLAPWFDRADQPLDLVGHSYGGAVALLAALRWPERVRRLVLFEPTLFALIDADLPSPNAADHIRETVAQAAAAVAAGDPGRAAELFIDYWMGEGALRSKPEPQRAAIEAAIVQVQGWGHALLSEATPLAAFGALQMPVLLMCGSDTTTAAQAVASLLEHTLPRVQTLTFEGLGHMAPITHPERVDAAIAAFLLSPS